MKYVFIDTNIFLHFQSFDTIDWIAETKSEKCTLVITALVIKELDDQKNGTGKKATRARKVLKQIEAHFDSPIRLPENVQLVIHNSQPSESVYSENNLSVIYGDQQQLAAMIEYRDLNGVTNISLCTDDVGVRLRAREHNIEKLVLSDDYKLPLELSTLEKENKKLQRELQILQNSTPRLKLGFCNQRESLKFDSPAQNIDYDNFRLKKRKELFDCFPELDENRIKDSAWADAAFKAAFVSEHSRARYAQEKKDYLIQYEGHIKELYEYERQQSLTFNLPLELLNHGTLPAQSIEIRLTFPDNICILEYGELQLPPQLPVIPKKPKGALDNFGYIGDSILPALYNPKLSPINLNPAKPNITVEIGEVSDNEVSYSIIALKHGEMFKLTLNELAVRFDSLDDIKNFQISYYIGADNVPNHTEGVLNISFK